MSYFDKIKQDGWFGFANLALLGLAGFVLVNKLSQKYPAHHNEKRILPKLLSKLSLTKQTKQREEIAPAEVFVEQATKINGELIRDVSEFPIYKIVITGGPCAGKTTAVKKIKQVFTNRGFKVMIVPDVPTLLVECGATIQMDRLSSQQRIEFQKMLIKGVIHYQDEFTTLASMNKAPGIVICDRGTMDSRAYISEEQFDTILHNEGWSLSNLRDRRYDEVIFMKTAADGAEEFYTLSGNVARHQGVETAKQLDKKTLNAWLHHPKLNVISNVQGETFDQKIERVINTVERVTGNSQNTNVLRYNVGSVKFPPSLVTRMSTVKQVSLINNDTQKYAYDRVQKVQFAGLTYNRIHGVKSLTKDVVQTRRPITAREFIKLVDRLSDSSVAAKIIERTSFVHNNQFFILDVIKSTEKEDERILTVNVGKQDEAKLVLPEFIQITGKL